MPPDVLSFIIVSPWDRVSEVSHLAKSALEPDAGASGASVGLGSQKGRDTETAMVRASRKKRISKAGSVAVFIRSSCGFERDSLGVMRGLGPPLPPKE